MTIVVRSAEPDDAASIARVQVATWRSAYKGIFPDELLDGLNDIRLAMGWSESIERKGFVTFVAERDDVEKERVVGFIHAGPSDVRGLAEVYTLYVNQDHQRRGIGRDLLAALTGALRGSYRSLVIRVLVDNAPGRAFYARLGGIPGEIRGLRVGKETVDEIAYDWPDLPAFAEALAARAARRSGASP